MQHELLTHPKYDPGRTRDFFEQRGWIVELVPASNIYLVKVDLGAACECGDGRFGDLSLIRKKFGPKIFGGVNGVAAVLTGGDIVGFNAAAILLESISTRAGTHGAQHQGEGCGLFGLWKKGELGSATHKLALLEQLHLMGAQPTAWIKSKVERHWGGKHFTLPGEHKERKLRFNPFIGFTPYPSTDRFSYDHWVLPCLGASNTRSKLFAAETVEKLSSVRTVEIITK